MNGLIISGHGSFATGLQSSLKLIAGDQLNIEFIDFLESDSTADLENKLLESFARLQGCDNILVLCDLVGGSPFKTAVTLTSEKANMTVIGGTNLAMVIETALMKDGFSEIDALSDLAINTGKEAIKSFQKKERPQTKGAGI